MQKLAVLSALQSELTAIEELMQKSESASKSWGLTDISLGTIDNKEVIALVTGAGKTRAAAAVQFVIDFYKPTVVIFIGAAGALTSDIKPGEVIIGERIIEHNFYVEPLALKEGSEKSRSWVPNPILVKIARDACQRAVGSKKVRGGTILTGDQVITNLEKRHLLRETFQGDCIDMEGAAIANICTHNKVPFIVIRIVSDSADHNAPSHFFDYLDIIGLEAACIVHEIIKYDF